MKRLYTHRIRRIDPMLALSRRVEGEAGKTPVRQRRSRRHWFLSILYIAKGKGYTAFVKPRNVCPQDYSSWLFPPCLFTVFLRMNFRPYGRCSTTAELYILVLTCEDNRQSVDPCTAILAPPWLPLWRASKIGNLACFCKGHVEAFASFNAQKFGVETANRQVGWVST